MIESTLIRTNVYDQFLHGFDLVGIVVCILVECRCSGEEIGDCCVHQAEERHA